METCKICEKKFKNLNGLIKHCKLTHNITSKIYYDKYLKKEGDGECVVCGNQTSYRNVGTGYLKNCSIECRNKNKDIKRDHSKDKKQSKETIKKRIKNTNQQKKEEHRKQTMLEKYGVDNPAKLDSIKIKISDAHRNIKKCRTDEWQKNIIKSKRINNTLKHSDETKSKISNGLNQYHSENLDREKYISQSNNVNHLSGWYDGLYFRSSLELSFLVQNQDKNFSSCENNKYKIIYDDNGKQRVYYPDFTDGHMIYEIKPIGLLDTHINKLKIQEGIKVYGDNYKIITEVETPYITKSLIRDLINCGKVKLTNRSKKVLEKYRF